MNLDALPSSASDEQASTSRSDAPSTESIKSERTGVTATKAGFVYVITHPDKPSLCKIGHSINPYDRLSSANIWCERKAWELTACFYFPDRKAAEDEVHEHFKDRQLEGEWFQLLPHDAVTFLHTIHRREQRNG